MTGWIVHSVVGDERYSFPQNYVLNAGTHVYIHSGPKATSSPPTHLLWTYGYIRDDYGDRAVVYDAAEQAVAGCCYKAGCR